MGALYRRFLFLLILTAGYPEGLCLCDEPLWIVSTDSNMLFRDGYTDAYRSWLAKFSPVDEVTTALEERMSYAESRINVRYRRLLNATAWARLSHITPNGKVMASMCWKVPGPESMLAERDIQVERMGPQTTVEEQDGFLVIRGPERVTFTKDGYRDIDRWLPLFLRYHEGWLFLSTDEQFVHWSPSSDLIKRLNSLADKSWFRESRPTKASKNGRQAFLAAAFAALGARQQRLDGESDIAFAQRSAPHALWELFLRTQFFHTESISGWQSRVEATQKVQYLFEVTAEDGSEFAEVLKGLRHRTLLPVPASSWCSATASFQIPPNIGAKLATFVPLGATDPLIERFATEVVDSLKFGSLHVGGWLQRRETGNLLNGVTSLAPIASQGEVASEKAFEAKDEGFGEGVFDQLDITPEGLLQWKVGQTDPIIRSAEDDALSSGSLPVLFAAKLNVLELAKTGKKNDEFDLYEFIQAKYLRYRISKLSSALSYEIRSEDQKALDALRDRIVGDDADRWTVSIEVNLLSRKRQLAIRVSVGDQLYGFLTVAENYWDRAAGRAVSERNVE